MGQKAGNAGDRARAQLAREMNLSFQEIASGLSAKRDDDFEVTFYCECGCLEPVKLTLSDFEAAGGALKPGHSRPEVR